MATKPEDIKYILPQHVDSTMLSSFRACPHLFYEEFCLGLRGGGANIHLHAGGCFAEARKVFNTEYHLNGKDLWRAKRKAHQAFQLRWGDVEPTDPRWQNVKDMGTMWLSFEDFLSTYPPESDHVQPFFIEGIPTFEHKFAIPLLPDDGFPLHPVSKLPFLFTGRFDMLGTWHGRPCVEDDKTGSAAGPTWSDQWTLRSQFIGYCWACQQEGIENLDTVVIRGVIPYKKEIRQLEAVKHYPSHVLDRWLERTRWDLDLLVHYHNHGFWPHDYADACSKFGSCAFLDLCYAKPENQNPTRTTYTVKRWDPLADDPTAPQPEILV